MLSILAQASTDISSVPADYVKNFFIMLAFVAALGGGVICGRRGSQGSPLHIKQPLGVNASVSQVPVYAHVSALDKLRADMETRTRENLRQHEENSKHLAAALEAGNERLQSMLSALHEMETRMTTATISEVRSLHERINPISEKVAAHEKAMEWIQSRIIAIWDGLMAHVERLAKNQAEDTRRLHSRIDDAMTKKAKA